MIHWYTHQYIREDHNPSHALGLRCRMRFGTRARLALVVPPTANLGFPVVVHSNIFQHLPTSSNIFQHLPISSNIFQYLPTYSNIYQHIPTMKGSIPVVLPCLSVTIPHVLSGTARSSQGSEAVSRLLGALGSGVSVYPLVMTNIAMENDHL